MDSIVILVGRGGNYADRYGRAVRCGTRITLRSKVNFWSRLGLAFARIYATMAAMNYMIQLLPVWRSINHGETDGLAMFVLCILETSTTHTLIRRI
jgi:hypothetical protein